MEAITVKTSDTIVAPKDVTTAVVSKTVDIIAVHGTSYQINLSKDVKEQLYMEFLKKIGQAPIIKHKCFGCGGTVEMDEKKHVFVCPYCGSAYAVGVYMINDRGDF